MQRLLFRFIGTIAVSVSVASSGGCLDADTERVPPPSVAGRIGKSESPATSELSEPWDRDVSDVSEPWDGTDHRAPRSSDAWTVVFEDSWRDKWYLRKVKEDYYRIHYEGDWSFRMRRNEWQTGDAAATYLKEGKALTLTGFYGDGDTGYLVLYPYTREDDETKVYRWYGAKHWVRDTQYSDNVWADVVEGRLHNYEQYGLEW